ncbi:MAG TPA: xanthine dehydrogenase family protein subunit M [Candidatus Acidoferrum sp.]|nr:xanthine dehydrogenase family protein subunit M [Candidatus Acidoferrum sp.]
MYAYPFSYHRAKSLAEATKLLQQLGEESRVIAGGQSLIPLMKMRLARPSALIDINFIPDLSEIKNQNGELRFGALARHTDIEISEYAAAIPILHDCAAGIADVQVRNQGTIGGSLAEADPSGDWAATLLALETSVVCTGPQGERSLKLEEFFKDAYTTALGREELVREVIVKKPPKNSGGAYLAFKRSAPVYATASAAVQLTLDAKDTCKDARIVLGCVGLTAIRAKQAETELRSKRVDERTIERAADAVREAAEPQSDMRGSVDYKRALVAALVKRAIGIAVRRARGERVEAGHEYVGR